MANTHQIQIIVKAEDFMQASEINALLQSTFDTVETKDIIALLSKVKKNPKLVKAALKFA